jgi:hypothetical protein
MPTIDGIQGQHLHFLFFARSSNGTTNSTITLNGGSNENYLGIVYDPGYQGCAASCLVKLNGSAAAQGGAPFLTGQIIADNAYIGGNSNVEVFYRPCDPSIQSCGTGPGSGLVE